MKIKLSSTRNIFYAIYNFLLITYNENNYKKFKQFVPDEMKDEKYWARRIKNNNAAKRSREARRVKENQIVIAATYLEHENEELRKQLEEYKEKCTQLQARLQRYE